MEHEYDVLIIGGGVVGCAIARELAAYRLQIGVLEKNPDVGYETSARNTGVVHGGFAYDVGSLKAALCVEGNRMMGELAEELHFPFRRCGKILVGHTEEEYARLLEVIRQGEACGASNLRMVDREELHTIIPSAEGNFALLSENSGIVDPFLLTSALAENAAENGVDFHLSCEVCGISREDGLWIVRTKSAVFKTRWIINSAGAQCGKISEMLGIRGYRIIYSKGDYIVLDPRLGAMVPMPIYTVPSNTYMGIHVTVTTEGNLLLGPTAENSEDPEDYGTEQKNLDFLYEEAMRIWPHFTKGDYIRTYSGVLPKWVDENGTIQDFRIEIRDKEAPNAVNLIGIESPGLTASVPIARYVIRLMKEREAFEPNADFNPVRNAIRRFADCTKEEQEALIRENPDYGEIVCRCSKVTRAEILSAIHNPLGARTMAAVKYRTRCMMGRCQGGYCQMRIAQMLETEAGLDPCEIMYARDGSPLFFTQGKRVRTKFMKQEIQDLDVLIIGGGPAGLAAALRLRQNGIENILIAEREKQPGGILRQCIHDGFGLTRFREMLSGPEYAERFIREAEALKIPILTNASVTEITPDRIATVVARDGLHTYRARAIILAMGCRERTRGALAIPGSRPAGVFTAGVAQAYINLYNRMPAREVVILGSGDIGMIMARRQTLEGAHVQAVFEILPYPSGLTRNIRQCLDDFGIPLHLSHTVTKVHGERRVTGVTVQKVGDGFRPVPGTEQFYSCDTLILSVGLIPENELSLGAGVKLDPHTRGPIVNERFETSVPGIFAAGNVLHVHDLADYVSLEAEELADAVTDYVTGKDLPDCSVTVSYDKNINHVIPQTVSLRESVSLSLRVNRPLTDVKVAAVQGGDVIAKKTLKKALPAEMISLHVPKNRILPGKELEVRIL